MSTARSTATTLVSPAPIAPSRPLSSWLASSLRTIPLGVYEGKGLLLTGTVGIGKTHLAAGILHNLIMLKGVRGLFCDYRELLKQIQNSYNPQVSMTELQLFKPVFGAECCF